AREFYEKARSLGDPGGLAQTTLAQFPQNPPTPNPSPFASNVIFINPAEALNRKGEVFAFYGMYDRAVAIYSMVVRMNPDHLPSMLNTAMAHYKNQDYNRA
ncbi:MAG: hypothetical protein GWM98_06555, partial [Nitrospinaceae bacterium]|nr:hypothetical protein [Nitrospinaceae bacterium]NIR54216.1 hypothetical protein [Nitrospinaceae bacterium]NIS84631.1 hypothetical protein [Nitrospinaceae bacterium]NIT81426.1 hypothetical protein [Nitrospinaceae bacterium]NIU43709.1 hypothetical protein [Nitrospinaceae bacterium]